MNIRRSFFICLPLGFVLAAAAYFGLFLLQLGVPTAEEIRALTRRVAELNESVSAIGTRGGARKTPRRKGTTQARRAKTKR